MEIGGIAPLRDAGPTDLSFYVHPRYKADAETTRAGALLVPSSAEPPRPVPLLRAREPYVALAKALRVFHPEPRRTPGVHPTAVLDPSVRLGEEAEIGPYAVLEAGVVVGARARIGAYVFLGRGTTVGDDFVAHPHVVVCAGSRIGDRVTLHPGVVVGADGFGYARSGDGSVWKIPQVGTVVIEDDVEIGANSTVDRATVGATRIGRGTKIDNLVMVAHGCEIGRECFLAAQVGLAGSSRLGDRVELGGQVGVAGHLHIGDGVRAAAQSGIPNDVPAGRAVGGYPAVELALWRRASAAFARLPELLRRLRRLERRLGSQGSSEGLD
ncbi:MAG: UDP-3-O-acylglucosamine N-acyltransferase [Candidatus Binatia bacterium]|nr:MAG: UDP-3-O-acylglucosamine N-acyltransferase [Candidatus Binatia bacterium]